MTRVRAFVLSLFLLLCLTIGLLQIKAIRLNQELRTVYGSRDIALQELDTSRNDYSTVTKLLKEADNYSVILEQQIAALKTQPTKIKYVVRTETILESGPTVIVKQLPDNHTFRLNNGIAVAAIQKTETEFSLLTYDLSFRSQSVMTEKQTSLSFQASSSEAPDVWVEVPVTSTTINTQPRVLLEPHVGIGVAIGYPTIVSAGLWTTLVHLPKGLDFIGASIFADSSTAHIGVLPLAYNIGGPLPVLTNLWLSPVITFNIANGPGGSLLLGGKL